MEVNQKHVALYKEIKGVGCLLLSRTAYKEGM